MSGTIETRRATARDLHGIARAIYDRGLFDRAEAEGFIAGVPDQIEDPGHH